MVGESFPLVRLLLVVFSFGVSRLRFAAIIPLNILGLLQAGLIEPSLKIHLPNEVVLIELLMSVNPDSCFALARPIQ